MNYSPSRRTIHNEDDFLEVVAEVKTDVSTFTENWMIEKGATPDLHDFIETYPLWDKWMLYDAIDQEIKRVSELVRKELVSHGN